MIATPLDERVGHVGGVESVVVDGRRWYFGMDYSSDLVVSPLIDDPAAMAEFAAQYMAQTDGRHDVPYWAEQVAWAETNSDLAAPEDHRFDRAQLAEGMNDALLYLFGCATGWGEEFFDDEVTTALGELGLDEDDWDSVGDVLDRDEPAAELVRTRLRAYLASRLPANWATVFAPLFRGGNEVPPNE